MTRPPAPPPIFRHPTDEAIDLVEALDVLGGALATLRAQLASVQQDLDEVIAGRTADRVDAELGDVLLDLRTVAAHIEDSAAVVAAELATGRTGHRRHAEAVVHYEQEVRRWRSLQVAAHG